MDEVQDWMEDAEDATPEDVSSDDAADADFASPFAPQGSPRPADQEAQDEANLFRVRPPGEDEEGRSPIPTLPLILRDHDPEADRRPTTFQTSRILRTLTQRDLLILQFLHDYRYLTTLQIRDLFFPSLRSAQMRLQHLRDLHLIYRWQLIRTPGVTRLPSMLLISPQGARIVAGYRGEDEKVAAEAAREARDHCHHAIHDLEANGFFVSLAARGRAEPQLGLLDWDSEERLRSDYRKREQRGRWPAPAPDGGGCLLTPAGKVEFELEWDRGTESLGRLRGKARGYVQRYSRIRDADRSHVLFVLSTYDREMDTRTQIWREHPRFASDQCCTFWTTTRRRLEEHGPLGPIWLQVDNRSEKRPGAPHLQYRAQLLDMKPMGPNERPMSDCIGKPGWWNRRPGGGMAA